MVGLLAIVPSEVLVTTPLYVDDQGRTITTHSMLQAFLRCPNMARYKYAERLKLRRATARHKPLKRGTWIHSLLEEHYAGRDWKAKHRELSAQFGELFDEEKESLGDLPRECARLMQSYLWHYGADKTDPYHGWKVKGTEITMECEWPDGEGIYRCRVDVLYEDEWGLWVGDHKSMKTLPDTTFRLLDGPSALYVWCARQNGYNVRGFTWNYLRTKPPSIPEMVYVGKSNERLSTRALETDYPTMYRALKKYEAEGHPIKVSDYRAQLDHLKSQRWKHGEVQASPFFRRDALEKSDDTIIRVVAAAMKTRDRMHGYDWKDTQAMERVVDRSCTFRCDYTDLCTSELFGGNSATIRRTQFRPGDPLDYYNEVKEVTVD